MTRILVTDLARFFFNPKQLPEFFSTNVCFTELNDRLSATKQSENYCSVKKLFLSPLFTLSLNSGRYLKKNAKFATMPVNNVIKKAQPPSCRLKQNYNISKYRYRNIIY